jgi:antitoxin component YwqK of YwqJK toxin-antitoxin module
MELPVPLVNRENTKQKTRNRKKIMNRVSLPILCFLFCVLCSFSQCSSGHSGNAIIKKYTIASTDRALISKGGIVKYKDTAVNGELIMIYPSGDISLFAEYKDGKENGIYKKWYEDGSLAEQRLFKAGRKEGIHYGWWPGGQRKFEYNFKDDMYEGSTKEWTPSGKLYKSFTYKLGQEEGLQQVWKEDGSLQANYVVRNGRKYGKTGVKKCKTVWDEKSSH